MKSDCISAYANLGYIYFQRGKTDLAIEVLNKCLKINDKTFSVNLDLAMIYYKQGELQESKKYLDVARSLEPLLIKGIDGINELEKEGYYWTKKDKKTLKKMFDGAK